MGILDPCQQCGAVGTRAYEEIAAVAEIPGRGDPKTDLLQLVHQWLCDARSGRWLMVLDNADDDGIFSRGNKSHERGPLVRFLPQAAHGSILITSRNGLAARNLVGRDGHVLMVHALECIPLAITQAGSYIANRLPLITISVYLQLFHESESKQTRLLQSEDFPDLRRDPSIRSAVITTWQLSFEQIRQERSAAVGS